MTVLGSGVAAFLLVLFLSNTQVPFCPNVPARASVWISLPSSSRMGPPSMAAPKLRAPCAAARVWLMRMFERVCLALLTVNNATRPVRMETTAMKRSAVTIAKP